MNKRLGGFLVIAVLAVAAMSASTPVRAANGIVEFLFPSLRKDEPDPSKTLVAPFAEPEHAGPSASPSMEEGMKTGLPENDIPLDVPHRNNAQMADWAVMAVSEAMTFEKDNYQDSVNDNAPHFDAGGLQQYQAFLADNNITKVLDSKRYYIRSFVQDAPLLLNEGAVDGRYRWLYEVPVMVSYMDRGMKDYKNASPVNQTMTITIQIGRTHDHTQGHDVVIERWSGKVENIAKQ